MRSVDVTIDARLHEIARAQPFPLLFATVSGAHLYGFPSPDSDWDLRGVHVLPPAELLGLKEGPDTLTIENAQGRPVWDLESYKACISLEKPAVGDANDTMIKKQSQCKIWQAGNERRILKRSHLCEHV